MAKLYLNNLFVQTKGNAPGIGLELINSEPGWTRSRRDRRNVKNHLLPLCFKFWAQNGIPTARPIGESDWFNREPNGVQMGCFGDPEITETHIKPGGKQMKYMDLRRFWGARKCNSPYKSLANPRQSYFFHGFWREQKCKTTIKH